MYVALTRPRKHLSVVFPLNAYASRMSADYSIGQVSRFFDAGVRAKMQRIVLTGDDAPQPADAAPRGGSPIDLRAILRGRFSS